MSVRQQNGRNSLPFQSQLYLNVDVSDMDDQKYLQTEMSNKSCKYGEQSLENGNSTVHKLAIQ